MTEKHNGVANTCNLSYLTFFPSEKHNRFLCDCLITLTDKADGSDPTRQGEH